MKKVATEREITLKDLAILISGTENRLDAKIFGLETRLTQHVTDKIEEAVETLAVSTAKGFAAVDARFNSLEIDVSILKTDVSVLKTDVFELKKDMIDVKDDVLFLRHEALNIGDKYVPDSTFDHRVRTIVRSERKAGLKKQA